MSKRFDVVASNKELVVTSEKSAVRVELQHGKDGEPTELVIAELYWKDGTWELLIRTNAHD
jgi:stress response protein SCP2